MSTTHISMKEHRNIEAKMIANKGGQMDWLSARSYESQAQNMETEAWGVPTSDRSWSSTWELPLEVQQEICNM